MIPESEKTRSLCGLVVSGRVMGNALSEGFRACLFPCSGRKGHVRATDLFDVGRLQAWGHNGAGYGHGLEGSDRVVFGNLYFLDPASEILEAGSLDKLQGMSTSR